jgi:hypothetical protein
MQTIQEATEHIHVHVVTMPSKPAGSFMQPPARFLRKCNKRWSKTTPTVAPQTPEEELERLQFVMEEIDSLVKGWETPKRNI